MHHTPVISIVTPVLNGAEYIHGLISSLKRQSFQAWEHIIVDGGSSDGTVGLAKSEYSGDPRLIVMERPGAGIYESVLEGFQMANGQILGWQNADDLYTPWAFAAVADFQRRTSASWLTGLPGCWDAEDTLRFVRPYGWYPKSLIRRGWFHAQLLGFLQQESMFFTKSAFDNISTAELASVSDASLAGDFMLWKRIARTHRLSVLPTVVSGFRRHRNNLSRAKFEQYMDEAISDGAVVLPGRIASLCRRIFRVASACASLRRVEVEDAVLNLDFELEVTPSNVRPGNLE